MSIPLHTIWWIWYGSMMIYVIMWFKMMISDGPSPSTKHLLFFFSRRCFELRGDDIGHPLCIAGAGNLSMSNSSNWSTGQWKILVFKRKCTWLGWFSIVMLVFGRCISCKLWQLKETFFCNPAEGAYETSEKYNLGAALFTYPSTRDLRGKQ